ncbi:MAG: HEAT repeat domain-containing protein [Anaerolineae bacterium]|nr:HEAT repeat domain-containing protein [Anaerolineae bacterium]
MTENTSFITLWFHKFIALWGEALKFLIGDSPMAKSAEKAKNRLKQVTRSSAKGKQSGLADDDSSDDPQTKFREIIKGLESDYEPIRYNSLSKLEHVKVDPFLTEIQPLLMDPSRRVRITARNLFKKVGKKATPILEMLLQSPNPDEQIAAIEIAAHTLDQKLIPQLIACLDVTARGQMSHIRRPVDETAAKVLQQFPAFEAQNAVAQWQKRKFQYFAERNHIDHSRENEDEVASSIEEDPSTVAMVPLTFTDETAIVNHEAAFAALFNQIRHGEWGDQNTASKVIQKQAQGIRADLHPELIRYIISLLNDKNWNVRCSAIEALAWFRSLDALPGLIAHVKDTNESVRVAALQAIAEIGDIAAASQIEDALFDERFRVRETAAYVIGHLRAKSSIPALTEVATKDSDEMVRLAALEALGNVGGRTINPTLLHALDDKDVHVRFTAARLLSESADEELVSEMIIHLADTSGLDWEDFRVCDLIAKGLERVDTPQAREAVKVWRQQQSLV